MVHLIRQRKWWYIISSIILIAGLISLFTRGLNLGIDFTGGNITEVKFNNTIVTTAQVRDVVKEEGFTSKYVQKSDAGIFLIRTEVLDETQNASFLKNLDKKLGGMTLLKSDKVGPTIGAEIYRNALISLVVASILITIYITWRFEFYQAIAAIFALLHDVFITLGVISILQLEVDASIVAAVLTIIGYSINDTIVIFDRIRENMHMKKGMELDDLVNFSLWQTMARSINTVLTVLIVLFALYLFGGSTIKNFIFALIVGVASGAYSSICVASPLWYEMTDKKRFMKSLRPAKAK